MAGVICGERLFFFLPTAAISRWDRKCLDVTPGRRREWSFALAANVLLLSKASWENRLLVPRNMVFIDSEKVVVRGTRVNKNFPNVDL